MVPLNYGVDIPILKVVPFYAVVLVKFPGNKST